MSMSELEYAAELFSGEQIDSAMRQLDVEDRTAVTAELKEGAYDPDAIEAFAKLARTLKSAVHVTAYYGLQLRRDKPRDELRDPAIRLLQRQAERGEIEPAYLHGRD